MTPFFVSILPLLLIDNNLKLVYTHLIPPKDKVDIKCESFHCFNIVLMVGQGGAKSAGEASVPETSRGVLSHLMPTLWSVVMQKPLI